ncbi:MAG: 4Fe-4S dicluster domain-containing protein [Candidatus Thorarchaeota archaeon]
MPGAIRPSATSPVGFVIPLEMMNLITSRDDLSMTMAIPLGRIQSLLSNKRHAIESLVQNPTEPATEMTDNFRRELETFVGELGIGSTGYATVPRELIFRDVGILYTNVVVLTMRTDRGRIERAPNPEPADMTMRTYDELGIATNEITDFLRSKGYGAQASHPLGGLVLYPPLAQRASLGWVGRNGLLITPEFGPRVRLAAVFTSIENLPVPEKNEHQWIERYCEKCGRCVQSCPPGAILEEPRVEGCRITHIDRNKCFPYFIQYYGCTICVKVCPFSRRPYSEIRQSIEDDM